MSTMTTIAAGAARVRIAETSAVWFRVITAAAAGLTAAKPSISSEQRTLAEWCTARGYRITWG